MEKNSLTGIGVCLQPLIAPYFFINTDAVERGNVPVQWQSH